MTAEKSKAIAAKAKALQTIVETLEELREDGDVENGDEAVEWVLKHLNEPPS